MKRKIQEIELTANDTILIRKAQSKAYAIAPFIILIGISFHFFPILEKGHWLRDEAFNLSLAIVAIEILLMNWKFYIDQHKNMKWVFLTRVDKIWIQKLVRRKTEKYLIQFEGRNQEITKEAYKLIQRGDMVEVHMAPLSKILLDIEILEKG